MAFTPLPASALPKGLNAGFTPTNQFSDAVTSLNVSQTAFDRSKVFTSPLHTIAARGNLAAGPMGALKGAVGDFASAGAQNAGPIGQGMLDAAPGLKPAFEALKAGTTPQGIEEQVGSGQNTALALGTGISGIVNTIREAPSMLKAFLDSRATGKALDAIKSTPETMTKNELTNAVKERIGPHTTGGGDLMPTDTETRAAELLKGSVGKNSVKNVPVINEKIATLGKEAEQHFAINARPISQIEHDLTLEQMRAKAAKYLPPSTMKPGGAYDHTIKQFEGELSQMTDKNTGTYYKALKNFEANVTSRLRGGVENLISDEGSAQLQAAKDVRHTVRDLISELHPEFKGKMFDLASLYDAQDTAVTKAAQFLKTHGTGKLTGALKNYAQKHPLIAGAAGIAGIGEATDLYKKAKSAIGF